MFGVRVPKRGKLSILETFSCNARHKHQQKCIKELTQHLFGFLKYVKGPSLIAGLDCGLDCWTGLLDWIAGLDCWTGLVDWITGLLDPTKLPVKAMHV